MDKKELKEMAKNYSGVKQQQQAFLEGFQRACEYTRGKVYDWR